VYHFESELRVKRSILLLVLVAACRTVPVGNPGSAGVTSAGTASGAAGASSPLGALNLFLAAAKSQDLQALSSVWGDENGPARDRNPRREFEQSQLVLLCLVHNDRATVGELRQAENGRFVTSVDMVQGTSKATVSYTLAKTPAGRWFVQSVDAKTLQNSGFCTKTSGTDTKKP
jgi:hypothetical protein